MTTGYTPHNKASNLLNLLEKYGHKAKIDIREAKIQLEADR